MYYCAEMFLFVFTVFLVRAECRAIADSILYYTGRMAKQRGDCAFDPSPGRLIIFSIVMCLTFCSLLYTIYVLLHPAR